MSHEEIPLPLGWIREFDPNHQTYFYVDTQQTPAHVTWDDPRLNPLYNNLLPSQSSNSQPFTKADSPPTKQQVSDQFEITRNWFEQLTDDEATPQSSNCVKDLAAGSLGILALSAVAFKQSNVNNLQNNRTRGAGWGSGLSN
ncbi:hypothetical protein WALSEDRAFT_61386 [Wallemia mellicola CBS 633.66]|uniref:WW domain-containing protein n=2 Tax=Wallemia mellicola TaxID=1708541 RepID=A0A4T0SLQ9_9BASI|nr:hypothetical protein WALSEDRAFT_61386 [Wallemia mellicola CBS 633.66]TIB73911.1 hypothetical protein E3Q23_02807 [Wallemia mellicola]EIM19557.1 hypothetical protein WALSEDRAFT_61386 [Wallemia mellicola CBS 633.66]TIB90233.1 hypothetical protein E3Q19_02789 [Wallemia mellicola]TIB96756.1 hypothetical protein E3Q18_02955 [Wallemia mellicola]TIB98418.1 hypothetical protein E3Q17_02997 [Wallemia mellicola]|eukprot:XP_006960355.1 hypothetical protein WALSEDRAFT_61386 [Wallemia mellicola CBS 633.66]